MQKSRLPVRKSTATATATTTTTMTTTTTKTKAAASKMVTPAKSEHRHNNKTDKKGSRLFSTTCSRMAQEAINYNKRPSHQQQPRVPFSSLNKRPTTMNKTAATTATTPLVRRKSPITQLKEDLETLRQKKAQEEQLIKEQHDQIKKLKAQLATPRKQQGKDQQIKRRQLLQVELEDEMRRKQTLQDKLSSISTEIEGMNVHVVDLLDVKALAPPKSAFCPIHDQIQELQLQLKTQSDRFNDKIARYKKAMQERDQVIKEQQVMHQQLQEAHAHQIAQLNLIHSNRIQKLQAEHKEALNKLTTTTPKEMDASSIDINEAIEKALVEFEQEQHNHAPKPLIYQPHSLVNRCHSDMMVVNQQWYTKQYMPRDAVSWPAPPQAISNKLHHHHQTLQHIR